MSLREIHMRDLSDLSSPNPSLPFPSPSLCSSSLLGSWSARSCRAVPVHSFRTKCVCDSLSTFAILARVNFDSVSLLSPLSVSLFLSTIRLKSFVLCMCVNECGAVRCDRCTCCFRSGFLCRCLPAPLCLRAGTADRRITAELCFYHHYRC